LQQNKLLKNSVLKSYCFIAQNEPNLCHIVRQQIKHSVFYVAWTTLQTMKVTWCIV